MTSAPAIGFAPTPTPAAAREIRPRDATSAASCAIVFVVISQALIKPQNEKLLFNSHQMQTRELRVFSRCNFLHEMELVGQDAYSRGIIADAGGRVIRSDTDFSIMHYTGAPNVCGG